MVADIARSSLSQWADPLTLIVQHEGGLVAHVKENAPARLIAEGATGARDRRKVEAACTRRIHEERDRVRLIDRL